MISALLLNTKKNPELFFITAYPLTDIIHNLNENIVHTKSLAIFSIQLQFIFFFLIFPNLTQIPVGFFSDVQIGHILPKGCARVNVGEAVHSPTTLRQSDVYYWSTT